MSARSISSGTISFGLVTIPVKLYSTGESAVGIHFNMVHKACGTQVKQRYFCPTDDRLVEKDEIVKGYEYAKGQFVLFTDEELKALNPEPTNAIEIAEFVPSEQVDPIYFEKSYYLGPDKAAARPYKLLAKAMRETGRSALARYQARGRDYLVLVRVFEEGLVMQQLRYADEVRAFSEVPLGEAEVKPAELDLALKLIDQIAADKFRPEQYKDEVREQTRALIDRKIEGQEITAAPQEAPKAQIIDLMEALKASLGEGEGKRKGPKRSERSAQAAEVQPVKKVAVKARARK
ncbi:MAG: Ku protein [Acidobacteriota bacterium]